MPSYAPRALKTLTMSSMSLNPTVWLSPTMIRESWQSREGQRLSPSSSHT